MLRVTLSNKSEMFWIVLDIIFFMLIGSCIAAHAFERVFNPDLSVYATHQKRCMQMSVAACDVSVRFCDGSEDAAGKHRGSAVLFSVPKARLTRTIPTLPPRTRACRRHAPKTRQKYPCT